MADTASTPTPGDSPAANSTPAPTPTVQGENSNGTAPTPFSLTERNAPLTTPYAFPPNCPAWTALDISGSLGARHDVYAGYAGPSNNIVNHARGYHELYCLPSIADSWYEEYEWPSNAASDAFGEGFGYLDGVGGRYERNGTKGAVCPAEWVARDVGVSSYLTSVGSGIGREMSTITFSTAFCCPRGYGVVPDVWYRSATLSSYSCVSWIEEATQLTKYEVLTEAPLASHVPGTYTVSEDFTNHTVVVMRQTEGLNQNIVSTIYTISSASVLQRPWAISWYEENRSTLSPMPPVLTGNMRIPEWTPGMEIKDGEYDRYPDHFTREEILAIEQRAQDAQNAKDRNLALGISFGVVGALLLALFVWRLWVVQVRKRKVARLREEGTDAQVEAGRTFWGLRRKRKDEEDERVMMKDMALPLEVN